MKRLDSLDALRGFDMFWIMGGESLICLIASLCGAPDFWKDFGHAPWDGLHFMDTVFPLFLFIAGVSFPFSAANSLAKGRTTWQVALRALRRGLVLFALGIVYNGFLSTLDFAGFRIWSVLGRIGLAWMFAAWIYLAVRSVRARIVLAAGLLVAVTLVTRLVLAPGAVEWSGPFSPEGNLGCWLDRTLTSGHIYRPLFDPEGFAGLLPAVVTAMLGMFAGELVRRDATGRWKTRTMLCCGAGLVVLGLVWSFVFPINKALWSPSFTLVVGGYSFLMFAVFYWIIDVKGWTRWSFFFKVIGVNSIAIYMGRAIIDFGHARDFFLKGLAGLLPQSAGELLLRIGYIAVCWLFLLVLYRKKIFIKV